ncbi:MAG: dockerin type I domain-containing protein [Hespellia sp.]|nr:dockerin type I domain-containing protein [Hespellia sp.]
MKKRVKKVMALVLAVSMMFGQTAFAEDVSQQQEIQEAEGVDENVPKEDQTEEPVLSEGEVDSVEQDNEAEESSEKTSVKDDTQETETEQPVEEEAQKTEDANVAASEQNVQQITIQAYCDAKVYKAIEIDPIFVGDGASAESYQLRISEQDEKCNIESLGNSYIGSGESQKVKANFIIQGNSVGTSDYELIKSAYDSEKMEQVETKIANVVINVEKNVPENSVKFADDTLMKSVFQLITWDSQSNQSVGYDRNQDGLMQIEEMEAITSMSLTTDIQNLTGLEYATNLTMVIISGGMESKVSNSLLQQLCDFTTLTNVSIYGNCEDINFEQFKKLTELRSFSYSGVITPNQEIDCINFIEEMVKNKLRSVRIDKMSDENKLNLMVNTTDYKTIKGNTFHPYREDIQDSLFGSQLTVEVQGDIVKKSESFSLIACKTGKTTAKITLGNASKTVNIEVEGIDENVALEDSKEKVDFATDKFSGDSIITVIRENKELWTVYPEQKKIKGNVVKYVAGYAYEVDESQDAVSFYRQILDGNDVLWNFDKKIADHVDRYDNHYVLQKDGTLKDIYSQSADESDVSDWGRKDDGRNCIGTFLLKTDGVLCYRDDVKKDEVGNAYTQIATNVKQLVKKKGRVTEVTIGYIDNNGIYVGNDGQTIEGVEKYETSYLWTKTGFYMYDERMRTMVCIADNETDCKVDYVFNGTSYDSSYGTYMCIVDENHYLYKVSVKYDYANNTTSYGKPELVTKSFDKQSDDRQALYIGTDGKYYDVNNREVELQTYNYTSPYEIKDGMLYKYGVAILSDTANYMTYHDYETDATYLYVIRTDGTVWDVTNIPKMITKYVESGEEMEADKATAIVDEIKAAQKDETVKVEMGTATTIPQAVLEEAKGKDVQLQIEMNDYSWNIKGTDITADSLKNVNLEVRFDMSNILNDAKEQVAGTNPTKEISLSYNGEFGFKGTLRYFAGKEYVGKKAVLYYYESDNKLTKKTSGTVDKDGYLELPYDHASDYLVVYESSSKKGDVNGDDLVNLKDLMIILKHVSGKESMDESKQQIADVNADGKVDLKDLMLILKFVSGKITEL